MTTRISLCGTELHEKAEGQSWNDICVECRRLYYKPIVKTLVDIGDDRKVAYQMLYRIFLGADHGPPLVNVVAEIEPSAFFARLREATASLSSGETMEQQTVLPLTEDGPWWACKFDGTVSNDGPFCNICGRTRGWAELLGPDLIPSSAPLFVRPRVNVVVGLAGRDEIVKAPRFYRLRRWFTKYMQ